MAAILSRPRCVNGQRWCVSLCMSTLKSSWQIWSIRKCICPEVNIYSISFKIVLRHCYKPFCRIAANFIWRYRNGICLKCVWQCYSSQLLYEHLFWHGNAFHLTGPIFEHIFLIGKLKCVAYGPFESTAAPVHVTILRRVRNKPLPGTT